MESLISKSFLKENNNTERISQNDDESLINSLISDERTFDEVAEDDEQDSEPDIESLLGSMTGAHADDDLSDLGDDYDREEDSESDTEHLQDLREFQDDHLKRLRQNSADEDDGIDASADYESVRPAKRRRRSPSSESAHSSSKGEVPNAPLDSSATSEDDDEESGNTFTREQLRLKQHRALITMLRMSLQTSNPSLSPDKLKECLEMIEILEEKYITATSAKKRTAPDRGLYPEKVEDYLKRLQGDEEKKHVWAATKADKSGDSEIPGLLMRAWDEISQCQIKDYRVGFRSGSSADYLNTAARRKLALTRHSDWGNRTKTPFISFSRSLHEIGKIRVPHFQNRQKRAGILDNTKLTIINSRAMLADRMPIIRMKTELLHYKVRTKYGGARFEVGSFFENEYLALYNVASQYIVGTWAWHSVEQWMEAHGDSFGDSFGRWYREVGVPAWKEHERVRLGGTPAKCKSGCDCCGQ